MITSPSQLEEDGAAGDLNANSWPVRRSVAPAVVGQSGGRCADVIDAA
jgi:hypothetical protein